jgi:hypothetical protein
MTAVALRRLSRFTPTTSMCMAMAGTLISAMGLSPQFMARTRCGDPEHSAPIGAPANKLQCQKLFGVALCLASAVTVNSANAQQTSVTKPEAALSAKITCKDFRKNSDGTWTSGPDTKIGANVFPNHTFDTNAVSIGGADLATVLNRKCGG